MASEGVRSGFGRIAKEVECIVSGPGNSMNAIFISYRRDDAEGQAGRLYDDIAAEFAPGSVFMDVAAINPGLDFRKAVDQGLSSCCVFLAVIGRNWLTATDPSGKRRLDDPGDFVRLEIAEALKRGNIPVIPVLVQGALMSRVDDLPDDLKALAYRNAVEISHPRWSSDIKLLIAAIKPHVLPPQPKSRWSRKWLLNLVALAIVLLAASGYVLYRVSNQPRPSTPNSTPTPRIDHLPDLSGVWLQTNPQTNVDKPDPPLRLRITQQGSRIAVEISHSDTFSGRPFGNAQIEKGRAEWTSAGGCGGSSTFLVYLRGGVLIYDVTDTYPVPCGGHLAGVEHRPTAELKRLHS